LAERFITPYLFALNTCQRKGDWCFYPGQLSAPPASSKIHQYCDLYHCQPHLLDTTHDYPADEYTLYQSFNNSALAKEYMTFHWDNFITKADVQALQKAGITHIRVPVPHYMMGDIHPGEPWIDGQWLYFVRFCGWARQYDIQVWIDLHTAPGSQNGFDNSGQLLPQPTCERWSSSDTNIERTIRAIQDISQAVMDDNLRDVVTGFGILNEPYMDCDMPTVKKFNNDALSTVRKIMGEDTAVYMADSFNATKWNDGWWTDPDIYSNTYLDSHYYHVFADHERELSPKQHIAYTCAKLSRETASCCYEDAPKNKLVSTGISRIIGEWSAAFDSLPVAVLSDIMGNISKKGEAPMMDRQLSKQRQNFLEQLVKAQMVIYENAHTGVSSGWFFWTVKMEGGAFAEWDYLRGVTEGWIPELPPPHVASEAMFGDCQEIVKDTTNDMSIVQEYPNPENSDTWAGPPIDDDYVLSVSGEKPRDQNKPIPTDQPASKPESKSDTETKESGKEPTSPPGKKAKTTSGWHWFRWFSTILICYGIWHVFLKDEYGFGRSRNEYTPLSSATQLNI
jgi:glucan 1,3-beta-glucosidase